MGTLLQTFRQLVTINLGGRSDPDTLKVVDAAVNWAALAAALIFDPPELHAEADVTLTGGSSSIDLDTVLTRYLDLIAVKNKTTGLPLYFIPFEVWFVALPSTVSGVRFYTLHGSVMHVYAAPSANQTFTVHYRRYPRELVNPTDALEFELHDGFIVSVASGVAWAAFEEGEAAGVWEKVAQFFTTPLVLGAQARALVAGRTVLLEQAIKGEVK